MHIPIATDDLNTIMQQHQMERTAGGTQIMCIGAEGAQPLCDYISPQFAKAAHDPSQDLTQERTLNADALNL